MAETSERISLEVAVDYLTAAMLSPMSENVCGKAMGVAADRIDEAVESCTTLDAKIEFTTAYGTLIRAGMAFLISDMPEFDFVMMISYHSECNCDLSHAGMKELHELPTRSRPDIPFPLSAPPLGSTQECLQYITVGCIVKVIVLALSNLTHISTSGPNGDGDEGPWPQSISRDVFPDGIHRAVHGLQTWNTQATGGLIFTLASHLATHFDAFARELHRVALPTLLIHQPIHFLHGAVNSYHKSIDGEIPASMGPLLFDIPVRAIIEFWEDLELLDASGFDTQLWASAEELYPVLAELHDILPAESPVKRTVHRYLAKVIDDCNGKIAIARKRRRSWGPGSGFNVAQLLPPDFEKYAQRLRQDHEHVASTEVEGDAVDEGQEPEQQMESVVEEVDIIIPDGGEADAESEGMEDDTDVVEPQDAPEIQDVSELQDTPEIQDAPELQDASELQDTPEIQDAPKPDESAPAPIEPIVLSEAEIEMYTLQQAFNYLSRARKSGCWNISCPSFETVIRTQLCGGCLLFRYCSPDCQKKAWKEGPCPHEPLCATIQTFMMAVGREGWEALGTPEYTFDAFHSMCIEKELDVEAPKLIALMIRSIINQKNVRRRQEQLAMSRVGLPEHIQRILDNLVPDRPVFKDVLEETPSVDDIQKNLDDLLARCSVGMGHQATA